MNTDNTNTVTTQTPTPTSTPTSASTSAEGAVKRTCKSCGSAKSLSEFYSTGRAGKHYPYCRECWSIDMRRRLLNRKLAEGTATPEMMQELDTINQLYDARRAAGLQNPGESKASPACVTGIVARQLEMFNKAE